MNINPTHVHENKCQWHADQMLTFALNALRDNRANLALIDLKQALSFAQRAGNKTQAGKILHSINLVRLMG